MRRSPRELTYEERRGLVHLIVAYGPDCFRREALEAGRWRTDGGAALKTFFIGVCLPQFKAAFEAWAPDSAPEETAHDHEQLDLVEPWVTPACPRPCDEVVLRERTWNVVDASDLVTGRILVCIAAGMNYPQAAGDRRGADRRRDQRPDPTASRQAPARPRPRGRPP